MYIFLHSKLVIVICDGFEPPTIFQIL